MCGQNLGVASLGTRHQLLREFVQETTEIDLAEEDIVIALEFVGAGLLVHDECTGATVLPIIMSRWILEALLSPEVGLAGGRAFTSPLGFLHELYVEHVLLALRTTHQIPRVDLHIRDIGRTPLVETLLRGVEEDVRTGRTDVLIFALKYVL